MQIWNVATQACRRTLRGHSGWVSSLCFLNKNTVAGEQKLLVSASWDATIRMWRLSSSDDLDGFQPGGAFRVLNAGQGNALYCIAPSPDSTSIVVGCRQKQIQRWDMDSGALLRSHYGHAKEVHALDISENFIVSGSGDNTSKLWDNRNPDNEACVVTLREHTNAVMALQVFIHKCESSLFH